MLAAPLTAFVLTALVLAVLVRSPLGRRMADVPNERSLHAHVVPRIGGIGLLAGLVAAWPLFPGTTPEIGWAAVGYLVLFAVSIADDLRPMPVVARLLAQIAIAALWCTAADIPLASIALVVLAIVWSTNLYNFMDGSDGLAGGMAVFGYGAYAIAAANAGDPVTATLCASVAAAAAAFLLFNFHPASLFLGDSGSIPLGYLAAVLGWYGVSQHLWPIAFPVVAFFPFLFDASFTLMNRIAQGKRPWQAHREHLYQRAVQSGLGHRRVALRAYALMAVCTAVAIALAVAHTGSEVPGAVAVIALCASGLAMARRIGRLPWAST